MSEWSDEVIAATETIECHPFCGHTYKLYAGWCPECGAAAERDLSSLRAAVKALAGEMDERERAAAHYDLDPVASAYEEMAARLRALLPGGDDASRETGR